jgi:hypothetical protein
MSSLIKARWSEKEISILKLNYVKMSRKNLQKLLPTRSLSSLSNYAKKLGLVNYEGNKAWHSSITYNKNYFKEVNTSTCYWAGFIAADGYIDTIHNKIRIKLSLKDLVQLEQFKKELRFSGNIRTYMRDTNKGLGFKTCYLDLCGAQDLIKDLKNNFNIGTKKSLTLKNPYLPNTLHKLSYLKGLIDGDGSISKNGQRFELLCTSFISDWILDFCKDLEYEVRTRVKLETPTLRVVYKTDLNLLYLINSSTDFGLERKWSRLPYQVIDSKKSR